MISRFWEGRDACTGGVVRRVKLRGERSRGVAIVLHTTIIFPTLLLTLEKCTVYNTSRVGNNGKRRGGGGREKITISID